VQIWRSGGGALSLADFGVKSNDFLEMECLLPLKEYLSSDKQSLPKNSVNEQQQIATSHGTEALVCMRV
jgi:hypothetical protein